MTNKELLAKVIAFYVNAKTDGGSKCPSIDDMREIVQLHDIGKTLAAKD